MALSHDKDKRGYFHGTTACLSALYEADRNDELLEVLEEERFWPYRRWVVKALVAQGVAVCAALGSSTEANDWVAKIRTLYRRYPALQRELDELLSGA
jgi:hypothetical protein